MFKVMLKSMKISWWISWEFSILVLRRLINFPLLCWLFRFLQENIECDVEASSANPEPMVGLIDRQGTSSTLVSRVRPTKISCMNLLYILSLILYQRENRRMYRCMQILYSRPFMWKGFWWSIAQGKYIVHGYSVYLVNWFWLAY
jgi:hypothetical protein